MATATQDKQLTPAQVSKWKGKPCPLCGGKLSIWDGGKVTCKHEPAAHTWHELWEALNNGSAPAPSKTKKKEPWPGLTLAAYAEQKHFSGKPLIWLMGVFNISEETHFGKPAVAFPYDAWIDGKWVHRGTKLRCGSSHQTIWEDHDPELVVPYGLTCFRPDLPAPKDLVICEGESDVHTLALHNIAALGISGVNNWKPRFAEIDVLRNAERIFIVDEGGSAGEAFVQEISKDLDPAKVLVLRFAVKDDQGNRKDPGEVYQDSFDDPLLPSFLVMFNEAVAEARPLETIIQKTENEPFRYRATDKGNKDRLVDIFGVDIRLVSDKLSFARWTPSNGVWMMDVKNKLLMPLAAKVVETITPENTLLEEKGDEKWQRKSESLQRSTSMIDKLWENEELYKPSKEFNLGLWKLNTKNCTIDLETQQPYEWNREDYLTLQAPVLYDNDATCPQFDAYMQRTFNGDKDLIHWMLKAMGYSLTGSIGEQCFFVCLGPGGTGKSTLLMILCNLLGDDYSEPADLAIFDKSSKRFASAQSYEMATYPNKHFVFASEPESGAACTFEEAAIKKLTGSEKLKARQIYAVPGKFTPRLKLWFSMNHRPNFDTADDAMLRRLLIIPFENKVDVGGKGDIQDFADKIVNQEGPGILNRLLEGLHDWQNETLAKTNLPLAIRRASGEYWQGKHVLTQFFQERTDHDANLFERAGYLRAAYETWAHEGNIYPIDGKSFAAELRNKGFLDTRGDGSPEKGNGTIWHGLRLKERYRQSAIEASKSHSEPDETEKT